LAVAGPVTVDSSGVLASSSALPVNLGGTGQTSASAAFDALLPTQTNNANKLLGTDGTSASWVSPGIAYQTSAPDNPVTGQLWVDSDETGDSLDPYIIRRKTITATAGQTVFTTDVIFTDGYEQIYYKGVLLVRTTDYTTSGSTNTVTLLQGASAGDTVEIISSTPINLVNAVVTGAANTITAATTTTVPLTIEGAPSQSASLFNIKNNAGEIRHEFSPNGSFTSRGTSADGSALIVERYGPTDPVAVLALRGYGGTVSSSNSVSQDNRLGLISAEGWDGTAIRASSRITFSIDGPAIPGNLPGKITFNTVPVGGGAGHIERMRIDSAGNVGIGNTSPDSPISILTSTLTVNKPALRILNTNTTGTFNWATSMINSALTTTQNIIQIMGKVESVRNSGYIGYRWVGDGSTSNAITFGHFAVDNVVNIDGNGYLLAGYLTSNGAYRLQVNSQIFATSSSIATSDGRYKEEVDTITNGLSIVDSLRPVSFKWKDHPVHNFVAGKTVGFIAQEVQEALADYDWADNIIKSNYNEETEEEFLGIAESNIIPLLVSAVKELKAEFEEYKRLHS
jgi:hypothetical protein